MNRRNFPAHQRTRRRFPVGAEVRPGGVHFRVWAPRRQRVALVPEKSALAAIDLQPEDNGYFSGLLPDAGPGMLYRFRLDDNQNLHPDPASRFQPLGPHVSSEVIDPGGFAWTDEEWEGIAEDRHVIYEIHVGTFTPEGTWAGAVRQLAALRELGITTIQVMPVADFPGRFGWGYDGVNLFAPSRLYGRPDDFRAFIDRAHAEGLAVILDVVYNHLGPDGNYLREFAHGYFSATYKTDWGEAMNFDGSGSGPAREYFLANARYWIEEFHMDGLRLDATQDIFDSSDPHIIREITETVREASDRRHVLIVAENEPQNTVLLRPPAEGGFGMTAALNDDFHHTALVALTGRSEAYLTDYRGAPQEFVSLAKHGYLYQGQHYKWQDNKRGSCALDIPAFRFIHCLENHDQIPNTGCGVRIHKLASPARCRALTAVLLLFPQTPMLFQGQEFESSAPFNYFADHFEELAARVSEGRSEFMRQFPGVASDDMQGRLPDPAHPETFIRSKLDHLERKKNRAVWRLHRDLLALRRRDETFTRPPGGVDGAVIGPDAFLVRYFGMEGNDRLLLVNLGHDLDLRPAPEPLLAPPVGRLWRLLWSSEHPDYGGYGTPPPEKDGKWFPRGSAAAVMTADADEDDDGG